MVLPPGPFFDVVIDLFPAAQIEVTDTEIRALGYQERLRQRGKKGLINVIEYSGHCDDLQIASWKISPAYTGDLSDTYDFIVRALNIDLASR